ncbi:MAG: class II aldolase/adducin family protein [Bacteroidetes bacterium]|nr:class II aldolase/adducin family protein [Bacteroidota bacterium]
MYNEGVIKFDFLCKDKDYIIPQNVFEIINPVRNKLADENLIGQYTDGLCYGNISIRANDSNEFYISASDTGKIKKAGKEHYVRIHQCSIEENFCLFSGSGLPSSETLTHYIIYRYCKEVNSVIHIHNREIWLKLIDKVPTTPKSAEYGTIDMVRAVENLFNNGSLQKSKILVMHGHEEGVVCFGESADEAESIVLSFLKTIY